VSSASLTERDPRESLRHLRRTLAFDDYVARQTALVLGSLVQPRRRSRYRRLLEQTD
jgi:hypothetical protein